MYKYLHSRCAATCSNKDDGFSAPEIGVRSRRNVRNWFAMPSLTGMHRLQVIPNQSAHRSIQFFSPFDWLMKWGRALNVHWLPLYNWINDLVIALACVDGRPGRGHNSVPKSIRSSLVECMEKLITDRLSVPLWAFLNLSRVELGEWETIGLVNSVSWHGLSCRLSSRLNRRINDHHNSFDNGISMHHGHNPLF